jgi:hypothetical protein
MGTLKTLMGYRYMYGTKQNSSNEELFVDRQRLGKNFFFSLHRRLLLASTRLRSCQDVTTHSLRTHSRLMFAEVQIGVAEEVGEVRDTTDVLQGFHNHDVL